MEINESLIKKVAEVARLQLTDSEIKKFTPQLREALENFSKLQEVDTKGVKPSFQPVEIKNVLREDVPKQCLTQEQALSQTKHKKDGYFKGPRAV